METPKEKETVSKQIEKVRDQKTDEDNENQNLPENKDNDKPEE